MSQLELLGSVNGELRKRKGGVTELVQNLDVFVKIVDDVQKEPKAVNGILSILSFLFILFLLIGQLYEYFTNADVTYKFVVDAEYDQSLTLDIDMIVATPCSNLAIMPMGVDTFAQNPFQDLFGESTDMSKEKQKNTLKKNPSRFEMSSNEAKLWSYLQKVHKEHFKPGTALKPVNERTFLGNDVEEGLLNAADEKQRIELDELMRQQKTKLQDNDLTIKNKNDDNGIMLMMSNGFGVFQIISAGSGKNSLEEDEGTACRINGKIPVLKGHGDQLTISVGKSLNVRNLFAHLKGGETKKGNISHRIERFHFGPHVWGLVTPLAGNEQIIENPGISFQYYIKVVPTKIYLTASSRLFNKPEITYQYAVTYAKKLSKKGEHFHDSINFDYEFADVIVEVWPASISVVDLLLRICSIVGGVFATSRIIELIASVYCSWRT